MKSQVTPRKRSPLSKEEEQEYVQVSAPSEEDGSSTTPSRSSIVNKERNAAGGFGIFDKIYNYLNRQNKEDKE